MDGRNCVWFNMCFSSELGIPGCGGPTTIKFWASQKLYQIFQSMRGDEGSRVSVPLMPALLKDNKAKKFLKALKSSRGFGSPWELGLRKNMVQAGKRQIKK